MSEDEIRRTREWIRRKRENARLGELGREVFGTDFEDMESVESLRLAVDEMIRQGVIELRYTSRGVIATAP